MLEATGSVFTNKYAEGYPGRRYYGGCEFVDVVENLAIERAKKLFGAEHVNVQPHSGSQANMAVYLTMLKPGDTVLGMNLSHGGHLTHGHPLNFSGKYYKIVPYGVRKDTETIDYEELATLAREHKPKLIIVGASAYPRIIDFERISKVAKEIGSLMMVDMAHIAGLVAAGEHPTPVPHAEFVTSTTHKTLRGPRSGMVICRETFRQRPEPIGVSGNAGRTARARHGRQSGLFQGGRDRGIQQLYPRRWSRMRKVLAARIASRGFRIVSGGTDTHLMLVDVFSKGINGKQAEQALDKAGITVNKNTIPFDPKSADDSQRNPNRNSGADNARDEGGGNGSHRRLDRRRAGACERRGSSEEGPAGSGEALREVSALRGTVGGGFRSANARIRIGSWAFEVS